MSKETYMSGSQPPEGIGIPTNLSPPLQQKAEILKSQTEEEIAEEARLIQDAIEVEDEVSLILRIMQGDKDATNELLRSIYPPIQSYFERKLSKHPGQVHEKAEDLTQDTVFRTWRKISDYKPYPNKPFIAYAYGFAHNIWYEAYSRIARDKFADRLESLSSNQEFKDKSEIDQPEYAYIEAEKQAKYQQLLSKLSLKEREIVHLRCERFSYKEIGMRFNMTEEAARTRYYRIKLKLKKLLSHQELAEADNSPSQKKKSRTP